MERGDGDFIDPAQKLEFLLVAAKNLHRILQTTIDETVEVIRSSRDTVRRSRELRARTPLDLVESEYSRSCYGVCSPPRRVPRS